ncbi:MAG: hypothetical protein WCB61_20510, partial [Pseudolabrys sp.]
RSHDLQSLAASIGPVGLGPQSIVSLACPNFSHELPGTRPLEKQISTPTHRKAAILLPPSDISNWRKS